jgi:hypothetical protein
MKLKFEKKSNIKSLSICVVDNLGGCYITIAQELSKYFRKVYYHSVNQNPFPMISMSSIGTGYNSIERIDDFWSNLDLLDIIVFPDIYFKDWGAHLRKIGKMVWGGCESETIETDRHLFKDELSSIKMNVAPTKYIIGVEKLINYLKSVEDKWIKISFFRGNMETFHHVNFNQSAIWLKNLAVQLGPLGDNMEFIVENSIESVAEVGFDGWTIGGNMTENQIWGVEVKDSCYIGTHTMKNNMPLPVQEINNNFFPILQKYNHTGFYSTEIRVGKDGKNYYTDPCMRAGSPPSTTYMKLINNWGEIITSGCEGIVVEPKYNGKYGCELIIKSSYCNKDYLPITIPDEFKDNVCLKGSLNYKNQTFIVPFEQGGIKDMEAFGSVIVIGNDVNEILKKAMMIADKLEAYGLIYDKDALNRGMKSIKDICQTLQIQF